MNRRDFMKGALSLLPVPFIARAASLYLPPERPKVIVPEGKLFGMNDATHTIWTVTAQNNDKYFWRTTYRGGVITLEETWEIVGGVKSVNYSRTRSDDFDS